MKKAICVFAMLVMFGALCAGCKKADTPAPTPAAVEPPTTAPAENWTPPTAVEPPAHDPNDGEDHSGHGH